MAERKINPGNTTNEARHHRAHPGYGGGEDCNVCKAWWKMRKHEDNWRYYLSTEWGGEVEEKAPTPAEPVDDLADWEMRLLSDGRVRPRRSR